MGFHSKIVINRKQDLTIISRSVFLLFEFVLGIFAVGFTYPIRGNQFVYFARVKQSMTGLPVSDWFIDSKDSNAFFTLICKILIINNNYLLVNLLNLTLVFFGFHFLNTSAILFMSIQKFSLSHLLIIFLSTAGLINFFPDFHNGIAGMGFFSAQFQPSSFDCLLLVSLCVAVNKNRSKSRLIYLKFMAPMAIAILIHPSIALSSCLLLISFIVSRLKCAEELIFSGAHTYRFLLISILFLIPLLLNFFPIENAFYTKEQLSAFDYFARVRIPYHTMPAVFFNFEDFVRLAIILLALWLIFRIYGMDISQKLLLLFAVSLSFYSVVVAYLVDKPVINLSIPWRILGGLYPFFALLLLWIALDFLCKLQNRGQYFQLGIFLLFIILVLFAFNMNKFLLIFLTIFMIRTVNLSMPNYYILRIISRKVLISCLCIIMFMISFQKEIATWNAWQVNNTAFPISNLLTSMQNQGTGAVPTKFDNFRVDFGLDIYVDERAAPYDPNLLINWVNRLELAEKIQTNPELICNHIQLKGISWAIIPKSVIKPSCFSQSSSIDSNWILITNRIK